MRTYLLNCFLLMIPILLWNLLLSEKLPEAFQPEQFWKNVPVYLAYGENFSRILLMLFILLMPLELHTGKQKMGLLIYGLGFILYAFSWLVLICFPDSSWSQSLPGFMAPAFTPVFWLLGIGQIGNSLYFNLSFRPWMFYALATVFLLFHNTHAALIYFRMQTQ